ncbi:MAG: hypothetical protein Q8P59_07250 [Dehalococcoidia bacterium]|nr:hypothetical protein [Dehalococcoidia bacterium]
MNTAKLFEQGEKLHQEYLRALEAATIEERAEANRQTALYANEYGHSFAHEIVAIQK